VVFLWRSPLCTVLGGLLYSGVSSPRQLNLIDKERSNSYAGS
jgi:hypothetical protein